MHFKTSIRLYCYGSREEFLDGMNYRAIINWIFIYSFFEDNELTSLKVVG